MHWKLETGNSIITLSSYKELIAKGLIAEAAKEIKGKPYPDYFDFAKHTIDIVRTLVSFNHLCGLCD